MGLPWENSGLPAITGQMKNLSSATDTLPPAAMVKTSVGPARKLGQKTKTLSDFGTGPAMVEEVVPRGRRLLTQLPGMDVWAAPSMSLAQYNEFFEVCTRLQRMRHMLLTSSSLASYLLEPEYLNEY